MKIKSSVAVLRFVTAGHLLLGTGRQTVENYSLTEAFRTNPSTKMSE